MTVTLITGTNSGIGLATAIRLAGAGHQVYAGVRNPDSAQKLAAAIAQSEGRISMLELDVTNEATIGDAVAQVLSIEGHIDVLINNAGISRGTSVEETPLSAVRELFETNFFGTVRLTQELIPGMRERKSGTIVNMSSIDGRLATPNNAFYAASKFAVEAFSESLAAQLLPFNIRVAVIQPGFIATPIFENTAKAEEAHDPNSPYFVHTRRLMKLFAAQLGNDTPTTADDAARVIEHAISTETPKFRYLLGQDAELLAPARQRLTDEEWIEFEAIEDDELFYEASAKWLGVDLYRP
jgi:NAD(P)-dependent dehydrogenase (short-subunit alcohol dehydrogenase family)